MMIGGGKLITCQLWESEELLLESRHDVEEVSRYAETLNPINLFWRGSTFELGHLYLTNERLILLPYNQQEVQRAQFLQKVGYEVLDKVGMGIPKPEIQFTEEPLIVELAEIYELNPFDRQFGIHPTLGLLTTSGSYRFKFVPGESPRDWAHAISEWTECEISRKRIA